MALPAPEIGAPATVFSVLQHCLQGASVKHADFGTLEFRVMGLVEEVWRVSVDASGVSVNQVVESQVQPGDTAPTADPSPRATVFCSRPQLEALLHDRPLASALRVAGDRPFFERISTQATAAQDMLSVRIAEDEA